MFEGNLFQNLGTKIEKVMSSTQEEKGRGTRRWEEEDEQKSCGWRNIVIEKER